MKKKPHKRRIWVRVCAALIIGGSFAYLGRWGLHEENSVACAVAIVGMLITAVYILLLIRAKSLVILDRGTGLGGSGEI